METTLIAFIGVILSVLALAVLGIIKLKRNRATEPHRVPYSSDTQNRVDVNTRGRTKQKKNKKALWITLTSVLLLVAAGAGYWYFSVRGKVDPETVTPYVCLTDSFGDTVVTDEQTAMAAVSEIADQIGITDAANELSFKHSETVSGTTFYRFDQVYNGIPVLGRSLVISADGSGAPNALTCNYSPVVLPTIEPAISEDSAISLAAEFLAKEFECEQSDIDAGQPVLCVYSDDSEDMLAWEFNSSYGHVILRADDGSVISHSSDTLIAAHDLINADGQLQKQLINVTRDEATNEITLRDDTRGITVYKVPDVANPDTVKLTDADKNPRTKSHLVNWQDGSQPGNTKSAVDAMANMAVCYDFYKEVLKRDSFDDLGHKIDVYVDVYATAQGRYFDNAAYSPDGKCFYISLTSSKSTAQATASAYLDVFGHEYTHGVQMSICDFNWNSNSSETRSILEAHSDIMGEMIEHWLTGKNDWKFGAYSSIHYKSINQANYICYPQRDMSQSTVLFDYTSPFKSDIYHVTHYSEKLKEYGDYENSTIISHAAYLMNLDTGDKGAALNHTQLAHLWYGALFYLHADANFAHCRNAVEIAANNMLANGELTEKQVARVSWAFDQVGVGKANNVTAIIVKDSGFELDVCYKDGSKCIDYTYEITKEIKSNAASSSDVSTVLTVAKEKINSDETHQIGLPSGKYTLCIYATGTDEQGQEVHTTHTMFLNVVDEETVALPNTLSATLNVLPPVVIENNPQESPNEETSRTVHSVWNTIDSTTNGGATLTLYSDHTFAGEGHPNHLQTKGDYLLYGVWRENGDSIQIKIAAAVRHGSGSTYDIMQFLNYETDFNYSENPIIFTYTLSSDKNTMIYSTSEGGSGVYFAPFDIPFMFSDFRRDTAIVEPDYSKTVHSVWNAVDDEESYDASSQNTTMTLFDDHTFACKWNYYDSLTTRSFFLEGIWEDNGSSIKLVVTKAISTYGEESTDIIQFFENETGKEYSDNPVFFTYSCLSDNNTLTCSGCGGGSDVYFGIPDLGFMLSDFRRDTAIVEPDYSKTVHSVWNSTDESEGSATLTLYDDYTFACEGVSVYEPSGEYSLEGEWKNNGRNIQIIVLDISYSEPGWTNNPLQSITDYLSHPYVYTYGTVADGNALIFSGITEFESDHFSPDYISFMFSDFRRDTSIAAPDYSKTVHSVWSFTDKSEGNSIRLRFIRQSACPAMNTLMK